MMLPYARLVVFLLMVVITAAVGSSFAAGEWYAALNKPPWTPPPWVFAPAWSVLYVLMAMAMWRVWESGHHTRVGSLIWWLLQLGFNAAWSWLFFGLNRIGWAMLDITLLIGVVVLCMKAFSAASRTGSLLMLPYLLWLLFAAALNFSIWMLNGGGLGRLLS